MENTPKNHKLEYDLNLNTPSPKRSHRELSLKEKFDLIQARWIPFTVPHWNTVKKKMTRMMTFRWHSWSVWFVKGQTQMNWFHLRKCLISRSPCLPRKYTTESGRRASWNKKREDSEISECESDDEGDNVEMENTAYGVRILTWGHA
jgi:hypothetical protein